VSDPITKPDSGKSRWKCYGGKVDGDLKEELKNVKVVGVSRRGSE